MTTTTTTEIPVRIDIEQTAAGYVRAVSSLDHAATKELDRADIAPRLRELVRIRASQLNGCAYCVDLHTTDARAVGESEQRLAAVAVWAESPFFDDRERAALAWTESITRLSETHVPDVDYARAAEHFSPQELSALTALIVTINTWNALSVSTRAWQPAPSDA